MGPKKFTAKPISTFFERSSLKRSTTTTSVSSSSDTTTTAEGVRVFTIEEDEVEEAAVETSEDIVVVVEDLPMKKAKGKVVNLSRFESWKFTDEMIGKKVERVDGVQKVRIYFIFM